MAESMPRHWRPARVVLAMLSVALLVAGLSAFVSRAVALVLVPPSTPGYLSLWAETVPLPALDLLPDQTGYVPITATLDDAPFGSLSLEIRKDGALMTPGAGLTMTVSRCDQAWQGVPGYPVASAAAAPVCPSGQALVVTATPADDYSASSPVWDLQGIDAVSGKFLLVALAFAPPVDPGGLGRVETGSFALGLTASGDDIPVTGEPPGPILPVTGADALPLILLGAALLGFGLLAWLPARRSALRRPKEERQ